MKQGFDFQRHLDSSEEMSIVYIDKPEGITTHQSETNDWGIVEFIAQKTGQPLYVIHRLDKETSGILLAATNPETARIISEKFQKNEIKKKYLFLTDRSVKDEYYKCTSHIEKNKNSFISHNDKPVNAETEFKLLWKAGNLSLWNALPKTGKSHQIRLHAEALGIPILGDHVHNGTPWMRMCLHADQITVDETFSSLPPWWSLKDNSEIIANSISKSANQLLPLLKNSHEKRCRLKINENSCYRMSHTESKDFTIDLYGDTAWVNWYNEFAPNQQQLEIFSSFFRSINKSLFIRHMVDRGKNPNTDTSWSFGSITPSWIARENNLQYELRTQQGLSAGLFLDQKSNRKWVALQSQGLKVLNLFSYTCGFSVAAAANGAKEVCSVDASQNFLDWGKKNFVINNLDPARYEFWSQDCLLFLKGALKRGRKFDLIIVDPPSFGRSKDALFRLEKDWQDLLGLCLQLLEKKGRILFTTNFEKWSFEDFLKKMDPWAKQNKLVTCLAPAPELDYELSSKHRLLKSVIFERS